MIAFITGSGFYEYPGFVQEKISTPYGEAEVWQGSINGLPVAFVTRHGFDHHNLPNHINYKANIFALQSLGVKAIVSFSVVGATNKDLPLGVPVVVSDLYFPENRLPSGEICSFFDQSGDPKRGHLIAGSYFNSGLRSQLNEILAEAKEGVYAHVNGPRFNTKTEIKALQSVGVDMISQTCGPETILANELEIPYALVCFPIDYANGVQETPTSMEELNANLAKSKQVFENIIQTLPSMEAEYTFEGFVYRFEKQLVS